MGLTAFNKARREAAAKAAAEAAAAAPAVGTAEHYAGLTATQVIALVESGELSHEAAFAFEQARSEPRKTVLAIVQPAEQPESEESETQSGDEGEAITEPETTGDEEVPVEPVKGVE